MPLWRPERDRELQLASGGTGLEGFKPGPALMRETNIGATSVLESQGAISEDEAFRISSGEQALHVIAQGERVLLQSIQLLPNGGFEYVEQEASDVGRGALDVFGVIPSGEAGPVSESTLPLQFSGVGASEAPTASPVGSISAEALPIQGCESRSVSLPTLNFPDTIFVEHFNGTTWDAISAPPAPEFVFDETQVVIS